MSHSYQADTITPTPYRPGPHLVNRIRAQFTAQPVHHLANNHADDERLRQIVTGQTLPDAAVASGFVDSAPLFSHFGGTVLLRAIIFGGTQQLLTGLLDPQSSDPHSRIRSPVVGDRRISATADAGNCPAT